jgi:hypothetical protein
MTGEVIFQAKKIGHRLTATFFNRQIRGGIKKEPSRRQPKNTMDLFDRPEGNILLPAPDHPSLSFVLIIAG